MQLSGNTAGSLRQKRRSSGSGSLSPTVRPLYYNCDCSNGVCTNNTMSTLKCICAALTNMLWPCYPVQQWKLAKCSSCDNRIGTCTDPSEVIGGNNDNCVCHVNTSLCMHVQNINEFWPLFVGEEEEVSGRHWLVEAYTTLCYCSNSNIHHCAETSTESIESRECTCIRDLLSDKVWMCSPTHYWIAAKCGACSSIGYCAYPGEKEQTQWVSDCMCNKFTLSCIAVSATDKINKRSLKEENLSNGQAASGRKEALGYALKPAVISCDCSYGGGDCIPLSSPPLVNDTMCLCYYFPGAIDQLWPCYALDKWYARTCDHCFTIGSCNHVTKEEYQNITDPNDRVPCMCTDQIKMCVRVLVTLDKMPESIEDWNGVDELLGIVQMWQRPPPIEVVKAKERFQKAEGLSGMTDPVAIVSKAKENIVFAASALSQTERAALSYTREELITQCSFNGAECNFERVFKPVLDPIYGQCFVFNSNFQLNSTPKLTSERAGPTYVLGLRVKMFVHSAEYLPTTEAKGVRIAVHPPNHHPFPDTVGFSAPTGAINSFGIHMKRMHRMGTSRRDCLPEGFRPDDYIYEEEAYSVEGCQRSCLQRYLVEKCSCGDPRFPQYTNSNNCAATDAFSRECLKSHKQFAGDCDCAPPCLSTTYTTSYSASEWPAGLNQLSDCPVNMSFIDCLETFRQEACMVEVYFEELNYEQLIESEAYGLPNLIADFGGQLGLWLGVSVVTCAEFIVFVYDMFTLCLQARQEKRKSSKCSNGTINMTRTPRIQLMEDVLINPISQSGLEYMSDDAPNPISHSGLEYMSDDAPNPISHSGLEYMSAGAPNPISHSGLDYLSDDAANPISHSGLEYLSDDAPNPITQSSSGYDSLNAPKSQQSLHQYSL